MKFVRAGSGRPLLLIHGLSNLRNWDPVFATLSRERDVPAVDLPGFGHSPPLPGEVTVASLTDAVQCFIAEHDLGDVDVVGSSMGARMALELARRGHAGNVVSLDPGGFWTDAQVKTFGLTVGTSIAVAPRGSLKCSVVIGWGRNGRVTLPSQARQAQELFPDAGLRWFGNCGHFPHWDQPSDAVALILDATAPG